MLDYFPPKVGVAYPASEVVFGSFSVSKGRVDSHDLDRKTQFWYTKARNFFGVMLIIEVN